MFIPFICLGVFNGFAVLRVLPCGADGTEVTFFLGFSKGMNKRLRGES